MASTSRDGNREGVEFIHEDDGSVTARDLETGLDRGGETRAEALLQLAAVLRLEAGGGTPIDDPDEFLKAEMDIDPAELKEYDEQPEFLS